MLFRSDSLKAAGVQLHVLRCGQEPTGTAFICVSDDAENAITVAPGANARLAAEHLPPLVGYSHLLMQLETPLETVMAYARAARAAGVKVVLNAAPARALPAELLELTDILVVNEGELAAIAASDAGIAACLGKVQVPVVVVTLGARGCCARVGSDYLLQNAFAVKPVDSTGAGDTFCGVLVAALDSGLELAAALRQASAAGALACLVPGAQSSIPAAHAVAEFVRRQSPSLDTGALRAYCGIPAAA